MKRSDEVALLRAMNTSSSIAAVPQQNLLADRRESLENRFQNRRVKLLLLMRNLAVGGSERQLVALAKGLDREIFDVAVMCFYADGPLVEELNSAGVAERIKQNPELRFVVRERITSQFSLSALIGKTSEALLGVR
jgi:hypothetical protein